MFHMSYNVKLKHLSRYLGNKKNRGLQLREVEGCKGKLKLKFGKACLSRFSFPTGFTHPWLLIFNIFNSPSRLQPVLAGSGWY